MPSRHGGRRMSVSHFKRREFITFLGGTAVAWPLTARAQQADRIRLVGVLMAFAESDPAAQSQVAAFRGALAKLGWTEGRNLRIELRWGAGDANRISTFARELVELRPDAIVGQTTPVTSVLARNYRQFCRVSRSRVSCKVPPLAPWLP